MENPQNNIVEKKIRLAVIGSRTFDDKDRMWKILDKNIHKIEFIISGNAQGADYLAQQWALDRGIPLIIFPAKWKRPDGTVDKGAGFRRNRQIVAACDKLLAFHDGVSKGTLNSIQCAESLCKPYHIVTFTPKKGLTVESI